MPLPFVVSGALVTGVASGIWSYNRENYMWDWQNRQARDFQIQNMIVSRYGLFREDIRDLAGLTTSKMDSYLVVNTLKLGFIVSVFFNYDRTDPPTKEGSPAERQFELLFSICFLTAFQLLLTSVWFSMHASVVAQSFMTKMLLQTVRIPFPSDQDIQATAPEARDYEKDLSTAFRIPLMQGRPPPGPVSSSGAAAASSGASAGGVSRQSSVPRLPSLGQGQLLQSIRSSDSDPHRRHSAGGLLQLPEQMRRAGSTRSSRQPSAVSEESSFSAFSEDAPFSQLGGATQSEATGTSRRVSDASGLLSQAFTDAGRSSSGGAEAPCVAPHLKFYGLVMSNWQPFDLYSKICMSIGTSAMLSGIAYYGMFYTRLPAVEGRMFVGKTEGWYTFVFMSLLAWWSVTLDLILSTWEQILAGVIAMGAPICIMILCLSDDRSLWLMPLAVFIQAMWVWFLCGTAILLQDGWPRRWRASLFLDVLGMRGASRTAVQGGRPRSSPCRASAAELLHCLRAAVVLPMPERLAEETRESIHRLEEMLASTGPPPPPPPPVGGDGARPASDNGFWLVVPAQEAGAAPRTHWIHSLSDSTPGSGGAAQAASLEELLGAARSTLATMVVEVAGPAWTSEDAEQLAQYGGQMGFSSVEGFESQFRSKGIAAKSSMGKSAHRFFRAVVVFVCASWASTVLGCLLICNKQRHQPWRPTQVALADFSAYVGQALFPWLSPSPLVAGLARKLSVEPLQLPRPWYAPSALSCTPDGRQLALADGVRAFAMAANRSWLGPFAACGGADVAAVGFAPAREDEWEEEGPELVAASLGGTFPLPRGPGDAERCEAIAWAASTSAPSSAAPGPSALSLDSAASGSEPGLRGLAVRAGQLLALEAAASGAWEVAGTLSPPSRKAVRWVGAALHAGLGLALDDQGSVFELEVSSGRWTGPWQLEEPDLVWRGICSVSGGSMGPHWLVLGERTELQEGAGTPPRRSWELWHFERPQGEPVLQDGYAGRGDAEGALESAVGVRAA